MKIYISVDFEGINGVSKFSQVEKTAPREYNIAIEQLHKELNAVIKGAFRANVDNITVNDAHSLMTNIDLTRLDDRVELVTGKPKYISMMAGLDNSYQAAILLGYHAKSGTAGACMAHTFSDKIASVKINNKEVGEAYLNSLYAATLNVPVALVTGDEALTEEVYEQIGEIPSVSVKRALGMHSVVCKPNGLVLTELEEATFKTLSNPTNWIINKLPPPYELEVNVIQIVMADLIELMPGLNRTGSKSIKFTHTSYSTVYKTLQAICALISIAESYS